MNGTDSTPLEDRSGTPNPLEATPGEPSGAGAPGPTTLRADLAAAAILIVCTAALWYIRRHGPGWVMEEAMMLQAPVRVLDGAVPGADFDWFYGPLSLLLPAGVYKVAAPTLVVERAIGAGYVATLGVGLYFVGRRWSFAIGLAMGMIAILIGSLSMTALPIMGAIGCLAVALAFAVSGLRPGPRAWAAGLACACATGLRPEFALFSIVLLGMLTLVRTLRPITWLAYAAGLVPYVWLVFAAGLGTTWRNLVTDAMHVASERHLPWHADLGGFGLLAIVGVLTAVAAVILGFRRRGEVTGVALLGLGLIGVCLFPEYLQRADGIHVVYFTMVPLATLVPVSYELVGHLAWFGGRLGWRQLAALGVAALVVLGLRPKFVARSTLRDARTFLRGGIVYDVTNDGGVWYYHDAAAARDHERLTIAATDIGRPGDTLFVGPRTLERFNYADESFYTVLPGFAQHTHFYDFHPRIAHVDGDRLAEDVAAADVLILCEVDFDEDNLSSRAGSERANDVVAERFEVVTEAGSCTLYRRVDAGGGDS